MGWGREKCVGGGVVSEGKLTMRGVHPALHTTFRGV